MKRTNPESDVDRRPWGTKKDFGTDKKPLKSGGSPPTATKQLAKKQSPALMTMSPIVPPLNKSPRDTIFEADEDTESTSSQNSKKSSTDEGLNEKQPDSSRSREDKVGMIRSNNASAETSPLLTSKYPNPVARRVSSSLASSHPSSPAVAIDGSSNAFKAGVPVSASPHLASPVWGSTNSLWANDNPIASSPAVSSSRDGAIWGSFGSPSVSTLRNRSMSRGSSNNVANVSNDWNDSEATLVAFNPSTVNFARKSVSHSFDGSDTQSPLLTSPGSLPLETTLKQPKDPLPSFLGFGNVDEPIDADSFSNDSFGPFTGLKHDRRRSEASVAPIGSPAIGTPLVANIRSRSVSAPKVGSFPISSLSGDLDIIAARIPAVDPTTAVDDLDEPRVVEVEQSGEELEDFDFNDILTYEVDVSARPFILDPAILDVPGTPTRTPKREPFLAGTLSSSGLRNKESAESGDDDDDDFSPVPNHFRRALNLASSPSSAISITGNLGGYSSSKGAYVHSLTSNSPNSSSLNSGAANLSRDPPVLCSFHLEGNCRYGAQCRNIHGEYCSICGKAALIPNDSEQNEDHMFECAEKQRLKEDLDESRDFECERCGDYVVEKGKRFGVLTDCDHCFCLQCIKEYRNQSQSSECPVCGKTSYYVVPSNIMVLDRPRKEAIISHYKDKMKQIPCKYFDGGRGSCKFGANCHYAHRGDPITKARPRTLTDSEGEAVSVNSSFNLGMFLTSKKKGKNSQQSHGGAKNQAKKQVNKDNLSNSSTSQGSSPGADKV